MSLIRLKKFKEDSKETIGRIADKAYSAYSRAEKGVQKFRNEMIRAKYRGQDPVEVEKFRTDTSLENFRTNLRTGQPMGKAEKKVPLRAKGIAVGRYGAEYADFILPVVGKVYKNITSYVLKTIGKTEMARRYEEEYDRMWNTKFEKLRETAKPKTPEEASAMIDAEFADIVSVIGSSKSLTKRVGRIVNTAIEKKVAPKEIRKLIRTLDETKVTPLGKLKKAKDKRPMLTASKDMQLIKSAETEAVESGLKRYKRNLEDELSGKAKVSIMRFDEINERITDIDDTLGSIRKEGKIGLQEKLSWFDEMDKQGINSRKFAEELYTEARLEYKLPEIKKVKVPKKPLQEGGKEGYRVEKKVALLKPAEKAKKVEAIKTTPVEVKMAKAKKEGTTFDEWLKTNKAVYRGDVLEPFDLKKISSKRGISVTDSRSMAGDFVEMKKTSGQEDGFITDLFLSTEAKILQEIKIPKNLVTDARSATKKFISSGQEDRMLERLMVEKQQKILDFAKSKGYDGVRIPALSENLDELETVVFNKDVIKTKSQLKKLWNRAGTQQGAGAVAGVQVEDDKVSFDPKKAALGVAGVSVAKNRKAQAVLDKAAKTYGTKVKKSFFSKAEKVPTKTKKAFKRGVEKLLTPISTRLGKIAPELKTAVRKLDYDTGVSTMKDSEQILPFLQASKKINKIDKNDFKLLDRAMKNSDTNVLNALAEKYGLTNEIKAVRNTLNDIYKRGNKVGMDIEYRGDYFPRVIKDPEGLMSKLRGTDGWSQIEKAINSRARKLDINPSDLKPIERASIANMMLRGFGDKIRLVAPTHTKGRTIEFLTKDLDKFYADSSTALIKYVTKMNEEIAGRKFFGKELGVKPNQLNSSDSIGSYVIKLISEGKIKPSKEKEVADILRARFATGKMNEALQTYRNIEYLATMGNPISAVTQLGDLAWSLAENGFYRTVKGSIRSVTGTGIKKEALGIEKIAQEFAEFSKTSKMVERVFNVTGLTKIDRIGKEALINGYWGKIIKQAKKGNTKLMDDLKVMFGSKADNVMRDIANKNLTDDAKFVLFNKLADFQPISKAEMPEKYLSLPNGRIFYMLKSFTLKQIDVFRRNILTEIASGEPKRVAKGLKNLVVIGGSFMLANATADEIKDWMLGRKTSFEDRTIDNLMRLGGLSKYDIYNIRNEGLGMSMAKKILFPTSIADATFKDITNVITNKRYKSGEQKGERYKSETTQRIPIVGKMLYWWFGRGKQKEIRKEGGTTTTKSVPTKTLLRSTKRGTSTNRKPINSKSKLIH